MKAPALTNVFAFSAKRAEVAGFYEDVLGLSRARTADDSVWFEAASFERVRVRGGAVGALRDGYFLARDPDGRVFGVRRWR